MYILYFIVVIYRLIAYNNTCINIVKTKIPVFDEITCGKLVEIQSCFLYSNSVGQWHIQPCHGTRRARVRGRESVSFWHVPKIYQSLIMQFSNWRMVIFKENYLIHVIEKLFLSQTIISISITSTYFYWIYFLWLNTTLWNEGRHLYINEYRFVSLTFREQRPV